MTKTLSAFVNCHAVELMSRNCYCTREYNNTKYNIIISVRSHHSDLWKFGDILYISNQFGGLIHVMQRCILIACETKSPIKKNITFFKQSNCLLADHRAFIIFMHFGVVSSSCWILIVIGRGSNWFLNSWVPAYGGTANFCMQGSGAVEKVGRFLCTWCNTH